MASMPLVTKPWTSQPQSVVGLSYQAKADSCAFAMGANGYNAATQRLPIFVGTGASFANSKYGVAARGTTASQGIGYLANPGFSELVPLTSSFTVLALVRINTLGARRFVAGDYTASGSAAQYSMCQTNGNQLQVGVGTSFSIAGGTLSNGWHWLEHTYDLANNSNVIYVDGVLADANAAPARPTGAAGQFRLLSGGEYTNESFDGDIASFLVFKKVLSKTQRELYKSNQNLVFAPPQRLIFTSASAGGTSVSVAVADGADVLSASVGPGVSTTSGTTDGADSLAGSLSVIAATSSATTEGADVLAANVAPAVTSVSSSTTDGADVLASSISVIATASSATTDGADVLAANVATAGTSVSSATTDGADVLTSNISVIASASSVTTDGADALASNISVIATASSATTDGADTLAATVVPAGTAISSNTTDGADVLSAAVGPQVAAASATTDGADGLFASVGPVVGIISATVDGADVLLGNVAPVQSVSVSVAVTDGADLLLANIFTSSPGSGVAGDYETRKKKRFLVNHEGQTLAFDSRRAAERAIYQLGAKAVLVAQPTAVVDTAARLAAQRAIDDAQEEEDLEMLLLAL